MAERRRFHPKVVEDLSQAVSYYERVSASLANGFREAVHQKFDQVFQYPESHAKLREHYRAAVINRFPYVIVYEHAQETTQVLGVFHAASDSERWFYR